MRVAAVEVGGEVLEPFHARGFGVAVVLSDQCQYKGFIMVAVYR